MEGRIAKTGRGFIGKAGRLLTAAAIALASQAGMCQESGGIKISEILFNPPTGGADYVELYNDSEEAASLAEVRLAQWKNDAITKLYMIDTAYVIGAKEYCVITTDAQFVKDSYDVRHPEKIIEVKSMPSYNNASGTLIVCLEDTTVIDRLDYTEEMHSRLLKDVEGVALERRSFESATQASENWYSASSTAGYGTPTYANSQSHEFLYEDNDWAVEPEVFSPDNDGYNDLLNITYRLKEGGMNANIYVSDLSGRTVRHLLRGGVLGTQGAMTWDGTDEGGQRCRQGRYLLTVEVYNTDGKRQRTKRAVTVVSSF